MKALTAAVFIVGWLYTSLVEYGWHRWMLHSGHHAVHNAHHKAFYTGDYGDLGLLSIWVLVSAAAHVVLAWVFLGFTLAAIFALSVFTYLGALEFLHEWIHNHPQAWIAQRHIAHHQLPTGNFNVFLPVWDFIFASA